LTAAFMLRALKKSFFGEPTQCPDYAPISVPEKIGAGLLLCVTLVFGLFPNLLLERILPAVETMRWLNR
jgi:NADH:ubiquinone oxidoreductase subunit 4 (subunit M)